MQRNILAEYHVTNAKAWYEGSDKWEVPADPNASTRTQPPYRLSVSTKSGEAPVFSLTSVYVPTGKDNLSAFMSVGADAADPETYGKFNILRVPNSPPVDGPGQVQNLFSSDDDVAAVLRNFRQSDAEAVYGNLLTLPVGDGLLYVQPLYTLRESGSGNFPALRYVLASFGRNVGIGDNLDEALRDVINADASGEEPSTGEEPDPGEEPTETPGPSPSPSTGGQLSDDALELLQQASDAFEEAEAALQDGDLQTYAQKVEEARRLVERAQAAD